MALTKAKFTRVKKKQQRGRSDEQKAKLAKTNKKSNVSKYTFGKMVKKLTTL